jgi:hypothetical protein
MDGLLGELSGSTFWGNGTISEGGGATTRVINTIPTGSFFEKYWHGIS